MRTRPVKPGFFKDAKLSQCEPLARILFLGLSALADGNGRLKDEPREIKVEILAYDQVDIEALLGQLEGQGLITRYEAEQRYIQVSKDAETFRLHARPHSDESCYIPEPPAGSYCKKPEVLTGKCAVTSPVTLSVTQTVTSPSLARVRLPKHDSNTSEGWEEFWSKYPKKVAKAAAVKVWNRLQPDRSLREQIQNALARQASSAEWLGNEGRYIPYPATYLNQRRWEDELPTPSGVQEDKNAREATARLVREQERKIAEARREREPTE